MASTRILSAARCCAQSRAFSSAAVQRAVTNFQMPAMSPTMTEGGVASWKVKEGAAFSAGDVLLEIETDKATMDVEAQEDGVMGKIIIAAGAQKVPVGKTIALLAEEGDNISNLSALAEEDSAPAPSSEPVPSGSSAAGSSETSPSGPKAPSGSPVTGPPSGSTPSNPTTATHTTAGIKGPIFPSVSRLLAENHIEDASKIKGTGVRGMITKGDVLAFLGIVKSPTGSYKEPKGGVAALGPGQAAPAASKAKAPEPLTGDALRSLIIGGLASASHASRARAGPAAPVSSMSASFNDLLSAYEFAPKPPAPSASQVPSPQKAAPREALVAESASGKGLRRDDPLWDLL